MLTTDWSTLKSFVQQRSVSIQYVTLSETYYLWAFDGPMYLSCQIPIVTPTLTGSDQQDFENNFQSSSNQSIKEAVIQHLGADTLVLCPFGVFFTAAANQTTTYSYELTSPVYLRGGVLYATPSTIGDRLTVEIVDVNNILGEGANTVIAIYVNGWYVMPGVVNQIEDISVSEQLPSGLYVNFLYNNTSLTQATQVIVNFLSYQGSI